MLFEPNKKVFLWEINSSNCGNIRNTKSASAEGFELISCLLMDVTVFVFQETVYLGYTMVVYQVSISYYAWNWSRSLVRWWDGVETNYSVRSKMSK